MGVYISKEDLLLFFARSRNIYMHSFNWDSMGEQSQFVSSFSRVFVRFSSLSGKSRLTVR